MPSTKYRERTALGNGAAGTRRCRNTRARHRRRQIELGLIVFAALLIPVMARAEGLPALIRATAPSLGSGDADSPTRRQLAQGRGELETQADQLFEQLLKDPKNVDLTLRYAEAAAKLGNYEAAISSLERLLLLDRNFPGVRLQLAELYRRLNSFEMARSYLTQAEQEPGTTEQARTRIQALRADIDSAASGSRFIVNLITGLRHQSNASAEPAGADIIAGGVPQTLSTIFAGRPGWDLFATGNLQHSYDLGDVKLETNGIVYVSQQFSNSWLNVAALEVNSGPRFDVAIGGLNLVSARPYAVATEVLLGNRQYLGSAGAGLSVDRTIMDGLNAGMFYEFRSQSFSNTPRVPEATAQNATIHSFGAALSYQPIENGTLGFQTSYALTDNDARIGSTEGLVFRLSYTHIFPLPAEFGVGPLVVTPLVYRIYSWDTELNPLVSPTLLGSTKEWRYGLTAKLGLTDNIAANLHLLQEDTATNLPATRTRNTQVIVGLLFAY
jgi:tetratricopeptide (TPR) repeat protein